MTNELTTTVLFRQNYYSAAHMVINQGGTGSGKTYAILQVLFCLAMQNQKLVITVVSQDIPNLKAGALRDALNIYEGSEPIKAMVKNYNKSDRIFTFHNGTIMEFKSYSDAQDAKSGKRDYLFVNEANGVTWDVYFELALRTRQRVYIDYNPNNTFWVHDKLMGQKDVQLIISDHRHNPYVPDALRNKVELLKEQDYELWKVYARGLTGKITGLVFNNWHICEEIPKDAKLIAAGLDFGYTNDETGCIEVFRQKVSFGLTNCSMRQGSPIAILPKN